MRKVLVAAMTILWASSGMAKGQDHNGTQYPEYRAVVIYTAVQGGPELREVFGHFETLEVCVIHAAARRNAKVQRGEAYGIEAFCQYREDGEAQPLLLK